MLYNLFSVVGSTRETQDFHCFDNSTIIVISQVLVQVLVHHNQMVILRYVY